MINYRKAATIIANSPMSGRVLCVVYLENKLSSLPRTLSSPLLSHTARFLARWENHSQLTALESFWSWASFSALTRHVWAAALCCGAHIVYNDNIIFVHFHVPLCEKISALTLALKLEWINLHSVSVWSQPFLQKLSVVHTSNHLQLSDYKLY